MSTPPDDRLPPLTRREDSPQHHSFRLQYNTRQLLTAILIASIALGILFAFPAWLATTIMITASILAPVPLTLAVIYARGNVRAFCIGALFPALLVAISGGLSFILISFNIAGAYLGFSGFFDAIGRHAGGLRFSILTGWPLAILAGIFAVVIRRRFVRGWSEE